MASIIDAREWHQGMEMWPAEWPYLESNDSGEKLNGWNVMGVGGGEEEVEIVREVLPRASINTKKPTTNMWHAASEG